MTEIEDIATQTDQPIECPKCHTSMKQIDVEGVVVDRCQKCGGLWFDALEKDKLLSDRKAVDAIDTDPSGIGRHLDAMTNIACPRDRSTLVRTSDPQQRHIHYESCTVCGGLFLDPGELKDLSRFSLLERLKTLLG